MVQGYFIDERPMAELAEELQVTESRISQLRAEALGLLRDALNLALDPELVRPHHRPEGVAARRRNAYFAAVADRHASAYSMATAYPRSPFVSALAGAETA